MQIPNNLPFAIFARFYAWMTENPIWMGNSTRLLADVPTSGAPLRVLDLGAGPGNSAVAMGRSRPDATFIALDLSLPMLQLIGQRWAGRGAKRPVPLQADALWLPLANASVDVVTGHSFLYMLPDVDGVLREVHRVLCPGGVVAFLEPLAGTPDWAWLARQPSFPFILSLVLWQIYSGTHRRFSPVELAMLLSRAGFQHVRTEVTLGNFGLFGRGEKA